MVAICSIDMHQSDNYINYDDSDSSTDYFHGYTLCLAAVIRWINTDKAKGRIAERIQVEFNGTTQWISGGNEADIIRDKDTINEYAKKMLKKYEKRVKRICRECGYSYEMKTEENTQYDGRKWLKTWAVMIKNNGGE